MQCPFCEISMRDPHDQILETGIGCFVIEPLDPVAEEHLLVVSSAHLESAATSPKISVYLMRKAAEIARRYNSANIITSIGPEATQTIQHLHLHIGPRRPGDGLKLPWSP
jgi:histidine triad (HIT) family protein